MYELISYISIAANGILVIAGGFLIRKIIKKSRLAILERTKKEHFKNSVRNLERDIESLKEKESKRKPDIDAQEMLHNMMSNGAVLNITVIDPATVLFHNRG